MTNDNKLPSIDARLPTPGQLFIDSFGHVNTPIKAEGSCIRNSRYVANEKVAVVELVGVRTDDGKTTIKRVLDLGDQVEIVPAQPDIYVSFDVATRTWTILIDTMASADGPGQLNLNVALNDATLFDGDPEAPTKPEPPQEGDRVRLSGHTAILRYNVEGLAGTVTKIHGDGTANVTLDRELSDGTITVQIAVDQLTKFV